VGREISGREKKRGAAAAVGERLLVVFSMKGSNAKTYEVLLYFLSSLSLSFSLSLFPSSSRLLLLIHVNDNELRKRKDVVENALGIFTWPSHSP
jgi:hypothetical protein